MLPHRGPVVVKLSAEQAEGIYQVRIELEGLACQLFAEHASEEQRAALNKAFAKLKSAFRQPDPLGAAQRKELFLRLPDRRLGQRSARHKPAHAECARHVAARDVAARARPFGGELWRNSQS